jgi:polysaccharide pyruvyl transferase WcaK-like protein
MKKKIFLNGCYGACNLGDDIMMNITINDIVNIIPDNEFEIYVKNKGNKQCLILNNPCIRNLFSINKITELKLIANSDFYIWGGGTFLYEGKDNRIKSLLSIFLHIFIAKVFKTKIILYGIGFGPFQTFLGKIIGNISIKLSDFITVRDIESFSQIKQMNFNSYLTNDLVYRLNTANVNLLELNRLKKHIIINTVYHQSIEELETFSNIIIDKLKELEIKYQNVHFHLVSAWESESATDLRTNKIVLDNLNKHFNFEYTVYKNKSTNELLEIINSIDIVFAQRLHILLISILLNKKIYTYQYHSKIKKFLDDIHYKDGIYDLNAIIRKIEESELNFIYLKKFLEDK